MSDSTTRPAIRWPSPEVVEELTGTGLIDAWLQVRIEQALSPITPLPALRSAWFAAEATSLFLQRRAQLDRVVVSTLRLSDPELAQELFFSLQAAEVDFPQIAHLSEGQERLLGGRLGPIALGQLQPLVATQLRQASPGELLPPLELENGQILLMRLELLLPASQTSTIQEQLEQELFDNWLAAERQRLQSLQPNHGATVPLQLPGTLP